MKATIADIKRLAVLIKDQWSLCELFKGTQRAADAEMMVTQTIHACVANHAKRGEAFSFRGDGGFSVGGLVDNGTAYGMLVERGYFTEVEYDGRPVIFVTQRLVDHLDAHFAKKGLNGQTNTRRPIMKLLFLLVWFATILMLVLKLTGVTPDLSWWSVTCPLWGSTIAYYGFYAVAFVGGLLIVKFGKRGEK